MASLLDHVRSLVEQLTGHFHYTGLYPAEVAAQNDDGTLEIKAMHPKIAGLSRIPIRYGVPGVRAKIKRGSLVLVGFEGADSRAPYAQAFREDSITELTITTTGGGKVVVNSDNVWLGGEQDARPVARAGDLIEVYLPAVPPLPPLPLQGFISTASTRVRSK